MIEFLVWNSHTWNGNRKVGGWCSREKKGMLRVQGSRIQSKYSLLEGAVFNPERELLGAGLRVKLEMERTYLLQLSV